MTDQDLIERLNILAGHYANGSLGRNTCEAAAKRIAASGIETEGHDRTAGRGAEHESPTAESGDAQDIGGPSQ